MCVLPYWSMPYASVPHASRTIVCEAWIHASHHLLPKRIYALKERAGAGKEDSGEGEARGGDGRRGCGAADG